MLKITAFGKTYKCKRTVAFDQVCILPYAFVLSKAISPDDWAKNVDLLVERFKVVDFKESYIDGRSAEAINLPYFNWRLVINDSGITV